MALIRKKLETEKEKIKSKYDTIKLKELLNKTKKNNKNNKNIINNTQNITNNITNNQFNLQLFLNERCKDALNINDFVDSLEIFLAVLPNNIIALRSPPNSFLIFLENCNVASISSLEYLCILYFFLLSI